MYYLVALALASAINERVLRELRGNFDTVNAAMDHTHIAPAWEFCYESLSRSYKELKILP